MITMILRLLQMIGGVLLVGVVCWGAFYAISQLRQDPSVLTQLRLLWVIPGGYVLLLLALALIILGSLGFKRWD